MNPALTIAAFTTAVAPVRIGPCALRPMCAGHILALEAVRHPLVTRPADTAPLTAGDIALAATLLAKPAQEARALAADATRLACATRATLLALRAAHLHPLQQAIRAALLTAFSTALTKRPRDKSVKVIKVRPDGLGWTLSLITYLATELHTPIGILLDEIPLVQLHAFDAALHRLNGGDFSDDDYREQEEESRLAPEASGEGSPTS